MGDFLRRNNKRTPFAGMILGALLFLVGGTFIGTCWAGSAILKVITDPEGAKVTTDTGQEGITPCTLEVPEGKRSVHLKLRAYIAKSLQVEVSSTEPTEIKVKLVPIPTTMREGNPRYCQLQRMRD
jgi:hypothetical protein